MESDIVNIQNLFTIGKILGVTPKWMKNVNLYSKIHVLMLTILVISGTIVSVYKRYSALMDLDMGAVQAFLESGECVSELLFMVSCFFGVLRKGQHWKRLFYNISRTEELIQKLGYPIEKNTKLYIVRLCLLHAIFILMHAYEILVWVNIEELSFEYGYILYRIIMYYQLITIYTIVCIMQTLKKRYDYLNKYLINTLEQRNKIIVISTKNNQDILQKLYNVQKVYTKFYVVLQQINIIFGWTLFFNFVTYIFVILGNINYILKYIQMEDYDSSIRIFINYAVYSTISTVSTIIIVMSCDGVEQSGKNINKTCFLYQDVIEKPCIKSELAVFAQITEQLAPKISTAGFFEINQTVLSALFSAVITYLIIIIQFNIS